MKLIRFAFATALALCLAGGALAQNPKQINRQQQQAITAVQATLDAVAAQSDPLQLVFRKDVQHDLKMDLGQRGKFDNLHDRQMRDVQQARMQNRRNPAAANDVLAKQKQETQDKIDTLLSDSQKARLKQLTLQLQGNAAVLAPDVQRKLGLSAEQIEQIREIQTQHDAQIAEMQTSALQGNIQVQAIADEIQQSQVSLGASFGGVLTPEQTDQLKALFGPTFKVGG